VHIETRKAGNRVRYYLAHSIRVGFKVRKARIYLGVGLSKKELLAKRKASEPILKDKIAGYKRIGDPFRMAVSPSELKQLKDLDAGRTLRVFHLNDSDWKRFTDEFVYSTNAIEGSTVTLGEVTTILAKNEWPRERDKWEISETYGVAEAIRYIRKTKTHISIELIKRLHEIVFKNSKPFAGRLRKRGVEVVVVDSFDRVVHRGAQSGRIPQMLKELVKWYDENKKKYPPIILAIAVHNQFETIHPFADGNGRVGRLLLNNILIKHGLPPVNIELKHQQRYYDALREYQQAGNIRPMIDLVLKEYSKLKRALRKR
jgi:Fic family protein